ncbi:hypothetical protein HGI30_20180 [Paenibacillus albicereus]|uniref:Lipoprotein n=1 Tax=Paenibacillus albicereus TaxID=2726185 RepID=A0A6H2H1U0_9BACL|nr:PCYCGC motif-containing (lipo)protein [Paenibacillus albicereus]QJC53617.1 hypothetical protein HGI30_20180 [Paenibacillus albicereus]
MIPHRSFLPSRLRRLLPLAGLALLLLLAACSGGTAPAVEGNSESGSHAGHADQASGDLREETASADTLPKFLDAQPEQIRIVYAASAKASELLSTMPCYCGCMESVGHKSNLNCFVNELREDGSVVWDDHGTRCGVCLQIAAESISMMTEGKSTDEIRQTIEDMYAA